MPDTSGMAQIPPGVDPADWLKVQRQMQLAQGLQGFALSPAQNDLQQPAGGGKYYRAARVSPVQALSKLAAAMMANKGFQTTMPQMAQQYGQAAQAFAPGGQTTQGPSLQAAPPPTDPNTQSVQPALQRNPGQSFAQTVQGAQPQTSPQNPLNPMGLPGSLAFRMYLSDPNKYGELLAGTPEYRTALAAAGGDPQRAMMMLQQESAKKGAIDVRSGGMTMIPDGKGGYVRMRAPNLPPGYEPDFDAQGNLVGTHPAAGLQQGEASIAGATTAAKEANTPRMIPQGGGVEQLGYPPTPPALRPPGQAGGNYFKPQPPPALPSASASSAPVQRGFPTKTPGAVTFDHNLWPNPPQMNIPSTPGQTTNAYQQKIIDKSAEKHEELVNKYGEASALAVQSNGFYDQALKNLPAAETGPMSHWLTENRGKLVEMAPSLAPLLGGAGTVTPTLELNKALVNAGLQGAKANFGRITQGEVMMQKDEMSPSAKMTHDAIASLIHQQQIKNAYAIQQAKDYSEYHQANGDPLQFEAQYGVRRSIGRFSAQYDTPQAAIERLKQNPQFLSDFQARYGWNPRE
jgi:hypothetical protein